jgi:malate dehydrogenase (oxaloacetate-decarboxylating)(NADP+)
MVKTMAKEPIIFAMANPDPEIWPPDAIEARPDAIIATGRSISGTRSTMCWDPLHLSPGRFDVRATAINDTMKIAAARPLPSWRASPCRKRFLRRTADECTVSDASISSPRRSTRG